VEEGHQPHKASFATITLERSPVEGLLFLPWRMGAAEGFADVLSFNLNYTDRETQQFTESYVGLIPCCLCAPLCLCVLVVQKKLTIKQESRSSSRTQTGLVRWLFPLASSGFQPPSPKEKESGTLIYFGGG
jgi:hypothetical protein